MLKHIPSLIVLSLLLTSCSSHTDKIKQQLGDKFDNQVYENAGGEVKSKDRYDTFCKAIKQKKHNKASLQFKALKEINNNKDLQLVNAEINLADKDCK
ncbi:hypothetical protein [Allocoleopsis franciscana]|uniref:Lipoprotein n=1 Tax=Allocoleopsis franciscana PCC 7113 TaxID=1173027 RepID=K9WBN5_9CYAN|nr:hypothetical protein [Allocoleopsis franciscana]AFZ17628.1 hypothetical protein Mic7113_1769 [Allocoleopsis franciscana PCC 7113]